MQKYVSTCVNLTADPLQKKKNFLKFDITEEIHYNFPNRLKMKKSVTCRKMK